MAGLLKGLVGNEPGNKGQSGVYRYHYHPCNPLPQILCGEMLYTILIFLDRIGTIHEIYPRLSMRCDAEQPTDSGMPSL